MERVDDEVMSVNCVRLSPHQLRLRTLSSPTTANKTRTIHVQGTDSRCRKDTDPAHRQIRLLKQLAYQKPRGHSSVSYPQHATTIRRLWEVPVKWNPIIRPAMPMSVPPRAAIASSLSFDSSIWCVYYPHEFFTLFPKLLTLTSTKQSATILSQKSGKTEGNAS